MRIVGLSLILMACRPTVPASGASAADAAPEPVVVPSEGPAEDLRRVQAFHQTRPEYEQPLGVGLTPVAGVEGLSAEACGSCHPAIAGEWAVSTHAAAWTDRQFQVEIRKSGNRWLCLNCHTPLLVQQDRWPIDLIDGDVEAPVLVDNATFDADLRSEGVTCAACHVRDGAIHGPGLPDSTAPHPVVADAAFRSEALCLRCHQAVATYPGKDFVCTFDTGSEWAAGAWSTAGTDCVDCHMPEVSRPAAVGGPTRTVRRHWWRGAGIPKVAGVHPPVEANPPGLGLAASWAEDAIAITATNARAGHRLPTGDPERWVQIDVVFHGADGTVGDGWTYRIGQTWTWWPEPVKRGDNRLAPLESRTLRVPIPDGASWAEVVASSHRMTAETAAYHELEGYPRAVETHRIRVDPSGSTGGLVAP